MLYHQSMFIFAVLFCSLFYWNGIYALKKDADLSNKSRRKMNTDGTTGNNADNSNESNMERIVFDTPNPKEKPGPVGIVFSWYVRCVFSVYA